MDQDNEPYSLFFYTSPYKRSKQTYQVVRHAFKEHQIVGVQEEVQLREQDFGNFQARMSSSWLKVFGGKNALASSSLRAALSGRAALLFSKKHWIVAAKETISSQCRMRKESRRRRPN